MKLNEFEARLSSVSDAKLRLMYADSCEKGPAVAADLILAEAGRRGLDLDSGIRAATAVSAGETADGLAPDTGSEAAPGGEGESPKGAWLAEETSSGGLPAMVKILLAVLILGGIAVGVFLAFGRG